MRNLFSVYAVNAINGILGIISVPVGLATLGTSGYGMYSIYTVLASFSVLIDIGVGKNLARLLAADTKDESSIDYLKTAFGLYLIFSAALLLLLPFWLFLIPQVIFPVQAIEQPLLRSIIIIAVLEYLLAIPTILIQARSVAREEFNRYNSFTLLSGLCKYSLLFLGFLVFRSPLAAVVLLASRRVVDYLLAVSILGNLPLAAWRPQFMAHKLGIMLGKSSMLSVAQTLQISIVGFSSILVNQKFGLAALGLFRSAFDLASKIWFFSNGMGLLIFPRFTKLLTDNSQRERLERGLRAARDVSWGGYCTLAVLSIFLAPTVLPWVNLSSQQFISLFILLFVALCMNSHANLGLEYLQAGGRYAAVAGLQALSFAMLLATFLLTSETSNLQAIGWAWLVSQAAYATLVDWTSLPDVFPQDPNSPRGLLRRFAALAGTLIAIVSYFGNFHLGLQFGGALLVIWALISALSRLPTFFPEFATLSPRIQLGEVPLTRLLLSRILMSLNLSRFVIIRAQLFNLRFYPHVLSAALFCNSRYFAQEESIFKKLLRAGDTFVDIGAQIGAMSLTASHFVGPTGHVFAIEADRRILRYLRGNISLNRASNVIPLRADGDTLEEYRERTERTWPVHKATPQPGVDENAPEKNYILLNGPVRVLRLDQDAPEPFVAHFAGTFLSRAEYVYIDNSRSSPKQHEPISTSLLTWLRTEGFQLLAPDVAASPGRAFLLARRSSVNSDIVDTGGPALASVT